MEISFLLPEQVLEEQAWKAFSGLFSAAATRVGPAGS